MRKILIKLKRLKLSLVQLLINFYQNYKLIMILQENHIMENMDYFYIMNKLIKLVRLKLYKVQFMIFNGILKDKTFQLSVVLCQLNLFYLIKRIKWYFNLVNNIKIKLFGVIQADFCVWVDLEILMDKWIYGICKLKRRQVLVNLILLLIVNGLLMIEKLLQLY